MRRPLLFSMLLAILLALPVGGSARTRAPGDGTLAIANADGNVYIKAKGGVVGRCDRCNFVLDDLVDGDGGAPVVKGWDWSKEVDVDTTRYGGTNVRFRLIGGVFVLRLRGKGFDISAVGKGRVQLQGTAGTYSFDGEDPRPMPDDTQAFQLGKPQSP